MTECLRQLTFADLAAFAKALALSQHFGEIILLCTTQKQCNNEQNYAIIESVEMFKKSSEYMNWSIKQQLIPESVKKQCSTLGFTN